MKIRNIIYVCAGVSLFGCQESSYDPIDFIIASQGTQTDVVGGQLLEARNENRFNEIMSTIPSISGEDPNPNFEINQVIVILSSISVCSSMEITDVSENEFTRLVTVTEVFNSDPSLCDPTPEAFDNLEYAIVEFKRDSHDSVSTIYKRRNDF
ncbi:MAG: hypothetical protein OEX19_10710 [Gammaproteobacteria bacterium]|nr:hypothetical protein [Gammaproteobacteria bacterium]